MGARCEHCHRLQIKSLMHFKEKSEGKSIKLCWLMAVAKQVQSGNLYIIEGNGYQIEKTPVGGSCDEDGGGKGVQESNKRLHRREKTSWKDQREMRFSGQGC
jgi:hypothetical protein